MRDVYDLGDKLLIVSTDRISCFDVVLPTCIPRKGEVLTQLSLFWFEFTKDIVPNHFITVNVDEFPEELLNHKEMLRGRSMLVKKTALIPVECVVRGYLSGSGLKEYRETQSVCGIKLPEGLQEADKLDQIIFTLCFDKQFVRDYLETLDWDKTPPAPELPEEIVEKTTDKYLQAYKMITGNILY